MSRNAKAEKDERDMKIEPLHWARRIIRHRQVRPAELRSLVPVLTVMPSAREEWREVVGVMLTIRRIVFGYETTREKIGRMNPGPTASKRWRQFFKSAHGRELLTSIADIASRCGFAGTAAKAMERFGSSAPSPLRAAVDRLLEAGQIDRVMAMVREAQRDGEIPAILDALIGNAIGQDRLNFKFADLGEPAQVYLLRCTESWYHGRSDDFFLHCVRTFTGRIRDIAIHLLLRQVDCWPRPRGRERLQSLLREALQAEELDVFLISSLVTALGSSALVENDNVVDKLIALGMTGDISKHALRAIVSLLGRVSALHLGAAEFLANYATCNDNKVRRVARKGVRAARSVGIEVSFEDDRIERRYARTKAQNARRLERSHGRHMFPSDKILAEAHDLLELIRTAKTTRTARRRAQGRLSYLCNSNPGLFRALRQRIANLQRLKIPSDSRRLLAGLVQLVA